MGYGLVVFDPDEATANTGSEFLAWYDAHFSEAQPCSPEGLNEALRAFYAEIAAQFPPAQGSPQARQELDETSGEAPRPVPLAEQTGRNPGYVLTSDAIYINCPFPMVDAVDPRVRELAASLELGYFDPEEDRLQLPERMTARLAEERSAATVQGRAAMEKDTAKRAERQAREEAERAEYYSGVKGLFRRVRDHLSED